MEPCSEVIMLDQAKYIPLYELEDLVLVDIQQLSSYTGGYPVKKISFLEDEYDYEYSITYLVVHYEEPRYKYPWSIYVNDKYVLNSYSFKSKKEAQGFIDSLNWHEENLKSLSIKRNR